MSLRSPHTADLHERLARIRGRSPACYDPETCPGCWEPNAPLPCFACYRDRTAPLQRRPE